jgi:Tfp pilus assembly protein PilF
MVEKAIASDKRGRASLQLLAAQTYVAARNLDAAERALRKALEIDPANLQAFGLLGGLYVQQRKLDAARQEFENVVKREPKSVVGHTMIGMIYDAQKNTAEAEKAYLKALEIDPKAAVAANNLAWLMCEQNRSLDAALELAKTALSVLPDEPNVNDTLGWLYFKNGNYQEAITALSNSVLKDPKRYDTRYHLGMAYVRFGDLQKGREHLREALKLHADFPEAAEARKTLASIGG